LIRLKRCGPEFRLRIRCLDPATARIPAAIHIAVFNPVTRFSISSRAAVAFPRIPLSALPGDALPRLIGGGSLGVAVRLELGPRLLARGGDAGPLCAGARGLRERLAREGACGGGRPPEPRGGEERHRRRHALFDALHAVNGGLDPRPEGPVRAMLMDRECRPPEELGRVPRACAEPGGEEDAPDGPQPAEWSEGAPFLAPARSRSGPSRRPDFAALLSRARHSSSRPASPVPESPPPPPLPNREAFGIVGLTNTQSSSYMNCVLQLLFHCASSRTGVLSAEAEASAPIAALQQLFRDLGESTVDCSANAFIKSMGGHLRSRDAGEALLSVSRLINEVRLFLTTICTTTTWPGGSKCVPNPGQTIVRVGARAARSISDCISAFLRPQWLNEDMIEGQPTRATLVRSFASVSSIFVLHLTSFTNISPDAACFTVDDQVSVPVGTNQVLCRLAPLSSIPQVIMRQ
jgi:hypothetical protein